MSDEMAGRLDEAQQRLRVNHEPQPSLRYLTVPEVQALAHCAHTTVRKAVHDGSLRAFRTAERILVREADAVAWIERRPAHEEAPAPRPRRSRRRAGSSNGSRAALEEMEREAAR